MRPVRTMLAMLAGLAVALTVWGAAAPPAGAALVHRFKENFTITGGSHFQYPTTLTVDQETQDLLVVDVWAGTLSRWHPDGTPADFSALGTNVIDAKGSGPQNCTPPSAECDGTPADGFNFTGYPTQQVAVDNSGGVTDGDIYVTQGYPEAAPVVDIFASNGEYLGQLTGAGEGPGEVKFGEVTLDGYRLGPCGVTTTASGDLFVSGGYDDRIYEFSPGGNPVVNADHVRTFSSVSTPCTLAAGAASSAGSLFAMARGANKAVQLDAGTGAQQCVIEPSNAGLVAVDPGSPRSAGNVYVLGAEADPWINEYDTSTCPPKLVSHSSLFSSANGIAVDATTGDIYVSSGGIRVYTGLVPLPTVATYPPTVTGDTSATLNGTVNPEGEPLTACFFEYGTTKSYGSTASCVAPDAGEVGEGDDVEAVHAVLSGLAAETRYHYRFLASNANGTSEGLDATFKTPSKPDLRNEWTAAVTSTSATLKATINPENSETTYFVEWGSDSSYGRRTAKVTLAGGRDESDHMVSVSLDGLAPQQTYHWRIVAENDRGEAEGGDRSFTTFATAPPAGPPDGRVYELVSPTDKNSAELGGPGGAGGLAAFTVQPQQAAASGLALTYHSGTAFGEDPASAPASSQYLSRRGEDGWSTQNITPPFEEGYLRDPLVGFSADLSHAAAIIIAPALNGAPEEVRNIYWRDNGAATLTPMSSQAPTFSMPKNQYCLSYGGVSADSSRVFLAAKGALIDGDPVGEGFNLYEWSAAKGLRLVSVLPDEAPAIPASDTGFGRGAGNTYCDMERTLVRQAISTDGSRAFWSYAGEFDGAINPLFARVEGVETIQLDAPSSGVAGKGGGGEYWDASADGSKVFFTDTLKLTSDADSGRDLYRYDFEAGGDRLSDLTPGGAEAAEVQGVLGASEDGSYVYFVADGRLTGEEEGAGGEKAQAGQANLYVWHEGEGLRFVATLSGDDESDWASNPSQQTARVTPDGRHLAFLSTAALTGYDSAIASGASSCGLSNNALPLGPRCLEAYVYDAPDNALLCASCNPSNASPTASTSLPTWSTPYAQPRYLSDDGSRLFFTTADALTPLDTNGAGDVYQWERAGTGSCDRANPDFSAAAEGCVGLVSTGSGAGASYLLDASSSGNDVFLSTYQQLVGADADERYDIYDARVDGTPESQRPPACEGEACHGAASIFPSPSAAATAGYVGPANPRATHTCPKGTRKVKRKGKTACVKIRKAAKHRKHAKHHKPGKHHKRGARRGRRAQHDRGAGR